MAPTPALNPTQTSPPAASGWPYQLFGDGELAFGPNGTVYILDNIAAGSDQSAIVALDRAGHMEPGWPVEERSGTDFGPPAVGPDGSVYVEECAGFPSGCVLHRFDRTGRDLSGWPIELPSDFACPADTRCGPQEVIVGPDGSAIVSRYRDDGGLHFLAIDAAGRIKPGWPVKPGSKGMWSSNAKIGTDGTLFVLNLPGGGTGPASLAAYGQDGRSRAGWPMTVPDRSEYLLGPNGTAVVWSLIDDVGELCPYPRRTLFTVLGSDGRTLPGWPRGSTGHASFPVVGPDGTVHYVSATAKIYAHDRTGEVKAGWPVAVPGAGGGCGPERPSLAPDGTIYVLGDEVTALAPDGRSRPGWPYRPAGNLGGPCFDSECFGGHGAPAFGPDGTVYLVVYHGDQGAVRAEVVALDQQGQVKPGWPYRLPIDANTVDVRAPTVSPDGRVIIRTGFGLLALDPDGYISR